ncbi:hypothetical protein CGC21_19735 [Leishmania donovani]|uniref:Uncharacterized protein n=1 Tax=Leishmania donovani TaxID=5661 RepID=A0A504X6Q0_LEIDO|nr:hypothetical protein CGC21_19735 [Leishmania donovani]
MPIKAKAVDRSKTAAFDRGHFAVSSGAAQADLPKQSYYYEGERRYTGADATRSDSSSSTSSVSSSRSPSPYTVGWQRHAAGPRLDHGSSEGDWDMSDDEEVVRRARAATRALLGSSWPASAAHAALTTSAPAPNSRATTVRSTSTSAEEESSQPQSGHHCKNHDPKASPTTSDVCGVANDATTTSATLPSAVARALQWQTTNPEFQQLMALLAQDVQRERCDDLPPAAIAMAGASAEGAWPRSLPSYSTTGPTSTHTYAPPSRTFAALEDNALEQLYEDWCLQRGEGDEAEGSAGHASGDADAIVPEVFIAADHRAAAFSIAASAAHQSILASLQHESTAMSDAGTGVCPHSVSDAPFTWEELLRGEMTRRNTRHGSADGPGGGVMLNDPDALVDQATRRLQRFLQSVACVERLVRDRRFMRSVAVFLYEHHKVFLPHYRPAASSSKAAEAAMTDDRGEDLHTDIAAHADVEHTHAEHRVYEEFGERMSAALLSVLTHHVPGFDEAEFVEALYETPAAYAMAEDARAAVGDHPMRGCLPSVLSFPAWRLLLAMSGFESFFLWMMDYIYEEYYLDTISEECAPSVAVAGVRGLRALIRSTYGRPADAGAADASAEEARISAAVPGATGRQETLLHTPAPDCASASFFPTPPASAEGASRRLNGTGIEPYRKRKTTHPGRDLPPIAPNANGMMSASCSMKATFSGLSSSASGLASSPPQRRSERNVEQAPVAESNHAFTSCTDDALERPARSVAPKTSTGVTDPIANASARQCGGAARSKTRFSSTTRINIGTARKLKPQNPRLNH